MENFPAVVRAFQDLHEMQINIDGVIEKLVISNFSDEETVSFKDTIGEYLSGPKSSFAISSLFDRAKELSKIIKSNDTEPLSDFRKLIRVIVSVNNEALISYFETNVLKKNNIPQFFVLLEESIATNKDTSQLEDAFIQIAQIHHFNYLTIKKFLEIISKDEYWLIQKMLSFEMFQSIITFIYEAAAEDKVKLKDIARAIATYPKNISATQYAKLMVFMMIHTNELTDLMLQHPVISNYVLESALIAEQRGLAIKHYSFYLFEKQSDLFFSFEKQFLKSQNITPATLLEYVNSVPFSSKRLVLKKLVIKHAEKELVAFIKKFPEYQNLLPML